MAYTDINTVKKHLLQSDVVIASVENEEHTLWGTDSVQLNSALITEDSEKVKTIDLSVPYEEGARILSGSSWTNLAYGEIVPNSVAAANDELRTTIYTEGVDYVVDYDTGKIRRETGGSIGDGDTVYIWYQYYTVHRKDTDYTVDCGTGTIARISGGGIADGGLIYVDYETTASTVPDQLIEEAITEAEDKIIARLADGYSSSSSDQGLSTGATELAVSIVCNAKAMDIMNRLHAESSDDMARQWREMSVRYEKQAWTTLSRFLKKPALRCARTQLNHSLY